MNDMALEIDPRNAGVLREWDGEHGAYWAEHAATYNASVARYQPALLAAIGAQPGERILDVGCGSGELAIDLVRGTPGATALGVDLSTAQLEVARQQAGELPVKFAQADAQVHDFGAAVLRRDRQPDRDHVLHRHGDGVRQPCQGDPTRRSAGDARVARDRGQRVAPRVLRRDRAGPADGSTAGRCPGSVLAQ